MLKQWFLGRKKKSSKNFRSAAHRRHSNNNNQSKTISNSFPLADTYLVYRTNPVYIDEINHDGRAVHVRNWCSLACPLHLTTACSCKPAFIYCDSCGPASNNVYTIETNNFNVFQVQSPIYQNFIKMMPSTLNYTDSGVDTVTSNIYQIVDGQLDNDDKDVSKTGPLDHFFTDQQSLMTRKNSKKLIHIYMNSDFVSQIAVPNAIRVQPQLDGGVSAFGHEDNVGEGQQLDVSYVTNETDSLESLHIDERLFAINGQADVNWNRAVKVRSDDVAEVAPPDVAQEASAYEAVKDLYEMLSNSRERQVVTQAINGTVGGAAGTSVAAHVRNGSGKKFKTFVGNTYETLTKHVRHSYAKLVEEDSNIYQNGTTSGVYHIDVRNDSTSALAQLSLPSTYIEADDVSQRSSKGVRPSTAIDGTIAPEDGLTVEEATSDQFITKRDPKYGPQVGQSGVVVGRGVEVTRRSMWHTLRKVFRQKQYRDACKIIVTTLIGFTAFGIITALSLSINRR